MSNKFGGPWTLIKLSLLKNYLDAYVKVFKNQRYFKLIYLDAFAGSGKCDTSAGEVFGSAKIALDTDRFDEYIFIEIINENVSRLNQLKREYPNKKITIFEGNCNDIIPNIIRDYDWKYTRALAFLDPYKMELSFTTLESLAATKAFDIWYLFPLGQVTRSLRNDGNVLPSDIAKLNNLFGDSDWKSKLYYVEDQLNMFDEEETKRKDQTSICCYFMSKMKSIFSLVLCPICLTNTNNTPLFLLFFSVSNPSSKAQQTAKNIAGYLIGKENKFLCENKKA